jgi:hypothetical protein
VKYDVKIIVGETNPIGKIGRRLACVRSDRPIEVLNFDWIDRIVRELADLDIMCLN